MQDIQNWRERQRAAWVASCVKLRSSVYNNNDQISSWEWYISINNIVNIQRKLVRKTM